MTSYRTLVKILLTIQVRRNVDIKLCHSITTFIKIELKSCHLGMTLD